MLVTGQIDRGRVINDPQREQSSLDVSDSCYSSHLDVVTVPTYKRPAGNPSKAVLLHNNHHRFRG